MDSPNNPLPNFEYFDYLDDFLSPNPRSFATRNRKIRLIVKSRDLMASWTVIAKKTLKAMLYPRQEIIVQSQTEEKGYELIMYAKTLWQQMAEIPETAWLQERFPLKPGMTIDSFQKDRIEFANGSRIMALAQGPTKINSYHPSDLVIDEAALQPDGGEAYGSSLPVCPNITCLSSAFPSWYEAIVEPDYHPLDHPEAFFNPSPGVFIRETASGIPVLWLHYSADPNRDEHWLQEEKSNYLYDSDWEREQEMRFNAGGGELVLATALRKRQDEIIVREEGYKANPTSNFYAGMDWGEENPSSFHVYEVKRNGETFAIFEHYLSDASPDVHGYILSESKIQFADGTSASPLDVVQAIYSDPSIFWDRQQQETGGFKALAELFPARMLAKMVPGQRGQDGTCVQKIKRMWGVTTDRKDVEAPVLPVTFKIVCPGGIPARKKEGTFDWGCPNLVWEIMRLRRAQLGAKQLQDKNPTEKLIQKDNHAFDDLCQFLVGGAVVPTPSREELWQKRLQSIQKRNPKATRLGLNRAWMRFDKSMQEEKVVTYR